MISACKKDSLSGISGELALPSDLNTATLGQNLTSPDTYLYRGSRGIPFKARFFTCFTAGRLGEVNCSDPDLPNPNFQVGSGTATHLGKFNTEVTFCSGPTLAYGNGSGYLEAANGDRLYIKIAAGHYRSAGTTPHLRRLFSGSL